MERAARDAHVEHVGGLARSDRGTPRLDSAFERTATVARWPLWCFVNADIVLFDDFRRATERVASAFDAFLLIGECRDLDVPAGAPTEDPVARFRLQELAREHGRLRGYAALDYFVFPRGLFDPVPPFLIGRAGLDNWLVWRACASGHPVVDATRSVVAIHQSHDYSIQGVAAPGRTPARRRCATGSWRAGRSTSTRSTTRRTGCVRSGDRFPTGARLPPARACAPCEVAAGRPHRGAPGAQGARAPAAPGRHLPASEAGDHAPPGRSRPGGGRRSRRSLRVAWGPFRRRCAPRSTSIGFRAACMSRWSIASSPALPDQLDDLEVSARLPPDCTIIAGPDTLRRRPRSCGAWRAACLLATTSGRWPARGGWRASCRSRHPQGARCPRPGAADRQPGSRRRLR